nr:hypothetical protein [Tanacetum cinerariifolium]
KFLAPVMFMLFSGMDVVGYWITDFQRGTIYHYEWWAGWIEYSSSLTSIFWAPQNTIPGWMAAAFFLSRPNAKQFVVAAPLFLMACVLWSPFVALGVVVLMLCMLNKEIFDAVMLDVPGAVLVAIIAGLLAYYVTFDSVSIPRSFVWNNPCLKSAIGEPCFSVLGYVEFVVLEVLCIAAVAFSLKDTRTWLTFAACSVLLLLPFVQVGLYNDIAMSSSRPSLAVL